MKKCNRVYRYPKQTYRLQIAKITNKTATLSQTIQHPPNDTKKISVIFKKEKKYYLLAKIDQFIVQNPAIHQGYLNCNHNQSPRLIQKMECMDNKASSPKLLYKGEDVLLGTVKVTLLKVG